MRHTAPDPTTLLQRHLLLGLLGLLGAANLKVLATLHGELHLVLAVLALETEGDLLGGLGLLLEDWLGLTSITLLLTVVTPAALGKV